jgi:hypothetical protein
MLKRRAKKIVRTLLVHLPFLQEEKFALVRAFRRRLKIPSERDFHALSLFKDIDEKLFLDVGANQGQSADAIRMIEPNARIHMFEPNSLLCS